MKILLADPDPSSRQRLAEWMRAWGHQVTEVADGLGAWDGLRQADPEDRPELALLTQIMPDLGGVELAERLRRHSQTQGVYVLLVSCEQLPLDEVGGSDLAADDVLRSPLRPQELRARLALAQRLLGYRHALAQRNQEFRVLLEAYPGLSVLKDADGRWLHANGEALRCFGLARQAYQGKHTDELKQLADTDHANLRRLSSLETGTEGGAEVDLAGKTYWFEPCRQFTNETGGATCLLLGQDISARKALERQLHERRYAENYDPLTGLPNAAYFQDKLHTALLFVQKFHLPLSLSLGRLDHYPQLCERHGKAACDALLSQVAAVIAEEIRSTDLAGRLDADQFGIVCTGTGAHNALYCLNRIRHRLKALRGSNNASLIGDFSVNFGVAELVTNQTDADQLLALAREALGQAEQQTLRNRIVVHPSAVDTSQPDPPAEGFTSRDASLKGRVLYEADLDNVGRVLDLNYFERHLRVAIKRVERYHRTLSLCLCNIDHFAQVQAEHGQTVAIEVAAHVSRVVEAELRSSDLIGRGSAAEFYLAFPGSGLEASLRCLHRIQARIHEIQFPSARDGEHFAVSVSFGVTCCGQQSAGVDSLLQQARQALDQARAAGGNCIQVYHAPA